MNGGSNIDLATLILAGIFACLVWALVHGWG